MSETRVRVQASQVVDMIKIALQEDSEEEDEGEGEEGEGKQKTSRWPNAKAVGIILSKLRLPKERATSSRRGRHRLISPKEVLQLAIAHHLVHLTNTMSDMSAHVHMSDDTSLAEGGDVPPADTPPHNRANGATGSPRLPIPCAVCGSTSRWNDRGTLRCVICWPQAPPASSTRAHAPHTDAWDKDITL
jgi:hypothetical protein